MFLLGCQGGIVVQVRVTQRPADASTLVVTATLNEVPALGTGQTLSRTPDRFNVTLQDVQRGRVSLHLSAQNAGGCEIGSGDGAVDLDGSGTYEVVIEIRPQQGCVLEVELVGPSMGSVRSVPTGIDCGAQCKQVFARDQVVALTAMTSARFGGWFADASAVNCAGRAGCSISIGSGLTRVRANFIRPESCTVSGWCTEEGLPALPGPSNLYSIWGSSRDDVWVVGDSGTLLHGDGILWSAAPSVTARALRGVWGSARDDVWSVGESGAILHWNGKVWSVVQQQTQAWLNAVWGSGRSDVWAVGDSGTVLHWDGAAWNLVGSGTTRSLRSIWGSAPNDVWAVGDSGTVLRWDGASWRAMASGVTANLSGVWGTGASSLWIVGDGGAILSWDGGALSRADSGTTAGLHAVWGTGSSQVWAVANGGTMLLWNGIRWSPVLLQQAQLLAGIWGSGPRDVWAVGAGRTLLRYRP